MAAQGAMWIREGFATDQVLCQVNSPVMKTALAFVLVFFTAGVWAQTAPGNRPRELQSAKIIQTVDPVFPDSLIATYRRGGQVTLLISVNTQGKLSEWLPLRYTDPAFSDAAVAALKEWKFEPARLHGEPVPVSIELIFNFEVKGVVVSVTASDTVTAQMNDLIGHHSYAPCTLRELDRIPVPLKTVSPIYPEELAVLGASGDVIVEFYIDERGRVRMPIVTGQPHQELANLAVDAVRQWQFEPPTRRGHPVLVKVRQVLRFTPKPTQKK
jgi:TonB family protein